jgi:hypothetical protein
LDEILTYSEERSPQGAQRVQAIQFFGALRLIFYKATEEEITIIGVRHSARDPASMPSTSQP